MFLVKWRIKMNDIERRAILGDREAQRECTEKGIVLPCPCCGAGSEEITYCADTRFICESCGTTQSRNSCTYEEALARWNSRPAPPIGRCYECANSPDIKTKTKGMRWCRRFRKEVEPGGYCDGFRPKGGEENAIT